MSLSARNISVTISGKSIIRNIELDVCGGEIVGLIGPNGAGKSTLLKALLGFIPYVGDITLEGSSLSLLNAQKRARRIAYTAQGHLIHWPIEVERLVGLGRLPHLDSWTKITKEDQKIILNSMVSTDCSHLSGRIATTLSGGERSAVMIARGLAQNAPYLMLDEPTANLDPYHQLKVMEILRAEAKRGTGIVTVLHDLGLAARFCDKLYLIKGGELLSKGAPADVLTEKNLRDAYRVVVTPKGSALSTFHMNRTS